ncbi:hypothetical protein ANO11243_049280 [Dothideomycetidae sp. 11243]|nr:hypothetical protein ANO11243_049280 [fungal sp. No.11243]
MSTTPTLPSTMKAAVIHSPGGPSQLKLESRPLPSVSAGQVLIRVRAFGLNRSELFTRQGHSPSVSFPRILGIEATGEIVSAPGNEDRFPAGEKCCTAMGGMGRDFDGGYAEYVTVPVGQVQVLKSSLDWAVLGALPEMLQTSWGAVNTALRVKKGETLLVRGGTTSIGLAAASLASLTGATVISTSRSAARGELLRAHGAKHVVTDDGSIAEKVRKDFPNGVDKVLELVGTTTLDDSLRCTRVGGVCCMAGIVGSKWSYDEYNPMEHIPTGVCLTTYNGGPENFMNTPLQELADQIAEGKLKIQTGKTFKLDDIVKAHELMDSNTAGGKIVVLT